MLICPRGAEVAELQTCDLWQRFDERAGYPRFRGGAAVNFKIRKNDQFRQGHQPRLGVPHNPEYDVIDQLLAFWREAGVAVRPSCPKQQHPERRCSCPPVPAIIRDGVCDGPPALVERTQAVSHDRGRPEASGLRHFRN